MLSSLNAVSRTEADAFIHALSFTNPQIPLCGRRVLCAMLSPLNAVSRTEANVFIHALSFTNPQIPLCGRRFAFSHQSQF
jgi:hypothetical protein